MTIFLLMMELTALFCSKCRRDISSAFFPWSSWHTSLALSVYLASVVPFRGRSLGRSAPGCHVSMQTDSTSVCVQHAPGTPRSVSEKSPSASCVLPAVFGIASEVSTDTVAPLASGSKLSLLGLLFCPSLLPTATLKFLLKNYQGPFYLQSYKKSVSLSLPLSLSFFLKCHSAS